MNQSQLSQHTAVHHILSQQMTKNRLPHTTLIYGECLNSCFKTLPIITETILHKALPHDAALLEHGPGIRRAYTYKALNKLIQGSAADMTKKAMIELYKEGIIPHIQVHDELDISVTNDLEAAKIKDIMENAVDLKIPNKVDYEAGPNWGSIK